MQFEMATSPMASMQIVMYSRGLPVQRPPDPTTSAAFAASEPPKGPAPICTSAQAQHSQLPSPQPAAPFLCQAAYALQGLRAGCTWRSGVAERERRPALELGDPVVL